MNIFFLNESCGFVDVMDGLLIDAILLALVSAKKFSTEIISCPKQEIEALFFFICNDFYYKICYVLNILRSSDFCKFFNFDYQSKFYNLSSEDKFYVKLLDFASCSICRYFKFDTISLYHLWSYKPNIRFPIRISLRLILASIQF